MKNIQKYIIVPLLSIMAIFTVSLTPIFSSNAWAAPGDAKCNGADSRMFTFPKWQKGLPGTCSEPKLKELNDFWIIVMNGIEILLQLVAYVASGYVLWSGFKYMKSEGDPGKISESKMALLNAIAGLVVALLSVAIVEFIAGRVLV